MIAPPPARTNADRVVAEEDVRPLDGLDLWLSTQDVPDDTKKRVREKAMSLLGEVAPKEIST